MQFISVGEAPTPAFHIPPPFPWSFGAGELPVNVQFINVGVTSPSPPQFTMPLPTFPTNAQSVTTGEVPTRFFIPPPKFSSNVQLVTVVSP
jgi:hypothetical protein